jgi:MSHA biogenesis protein MshQ
VAYAGNPASFGTASAGNGMGFTSGKEMRFGRLRAVNANGSQLLPLQMVMQTQYWGSTGGGNSFITNTADSCTGFVAANIALGNYQKNLNACETSITVNSFTGGRSTLRLSAPGNGNNGSVDLTANLGTSGSGTTCIAGIASAVTGANRAYLQGNWTGGAYDQNPTVRAAFGVNRGTEEVVHTLENY